MTKQYNATKIGPADDQVFVIPAGRGMLRHLRRLAAATGLICEAVSKRHVVIARCRPGGCPYRTLRGMGQPVPRACLAARSGAPRRNSLRDSASEIRRRGRRQHSVKTVEVGDVVTWGNVPGRTLVRLRDGHLAVKVRGDDAWVADAPVTIIALGLTGQESDADLQRLVEVFEVREALRALYAEGREPDAWVLVMQHIGEQAALIDRQVNWPAVWTAFAERLHAAGWRPGMTAEDAARRLAEAR